MLSPEQISAVDACRKRPLVLITGPPGSGKTRLISELCEDEDVMLLSSTGTASDRITHSTGHMANTVSFVLHDFTNEEYHSKRLIIDEAGMLSTDMLQDVFQKLHPESVALIGDSRQLPCPEGFSALGTLMKIQAVPHIQLTRVFRRDAVDTALDTCIQTMGTKEFNPKKQDDTFRVVVCPTQDDCYTKAAELYAQKPSQILAYTNNAVKILNDKTEQKTAALIRGATRDGDRVVCTKNMYVKKELKVANGTCGTITAHDGVRYDNGFHDKTLNSMFVPCRSMTIHKSQGNEFTQHGVVVVVPWKGDPPLELTYTAISRFKKSATLVGTSAMLNKALKAKFQESVDQIVVDGVLEKLST